MKTFRKYTPIAACLLLSWGGVTTEAQPPASGAMAGGPPPGGFPNMPSIEETNYKVALDIVDGHIKHNEINAPLSNNVLNNWQYSSTEPEKNAVMVSGPTSELTITNSQLTVKGIGKNDFLGIGAGVMAHNKARLHLDNVIIETFAPIASTVVVASNAEAHINNSHLVANGGTLPADYKPMIGPGMMEPPAPLGLAGTARTFLAMSNSQTYIKNSHIEAEAWGAVSTDASGGNLYLQVDDSDIVVRGNGYGVYSDFGAKVVVNNSTINTAGVGAIIAGKASIELNGVKGKSSRNGVMIHSVMAFDPAEQAALGLDHCTITTGGSSVLVKSANATIDVDDCQLMPTNHVLFEVIKNDDPNATQTNGAEVPGVHIVLTSSKLKGDVIDTDPDRQTYLRLSSSSITGAMYDIALTLDTNSHWLATQSSNITVNDAVTLSQIDAPQSVSVNITWSGDGPKPEGKTFSSGGQLVVHSINN